MARRARFIRPAPRTKMWIGAGVGESTIAASTTKLVGSLSAGALALRPFTILRTHLELLFSTDQFAAGESQSGAFAEIVASEQATAIGITGLPDPLGDPEADFFVYQGTSFNYEFRDSTGAGDVGAVYTVDSKAMRKVDINQDIVTLFSPRSAVGALLFSEGRRLIQLH